MGGRVLLIGAGGQLGRVLRGIADSPVPKGEGPGAPADSSPAWTVEALGHAELDLASPDGIRAAVRGAFGGLGPEILVNAAAYTAVDKAEQEPELARAVNAVAPGVMAEEMKRLGGWLVHYSTDYVFDGSGTEPWRETDATGPLNTYGRTKLEGERAIAATGCEHLIFRTSWVYAAVGKNFLHTMLRLGAEREELRIVADQIGAPTTAEALSAATQRALERIAAKNVMHGVYHLACGGETSWAEFAEAIFAAFAERQKVPRVVPIASSEYPTPAKRPKNSRLSCEKFEVEFGYRMPSWQAALATVAAKVMQGEG